MRYVIDASAAIAILRAEKGHDFIDQIDDPEMVMISAVNLGEVAARQFGDGLTRQDSTASIDALGLVGISTTANVAVDAAEFRQPARAQGISQADCICIALAKQQQATLLTADHAMASFAETLGVSVELIR